MFLRKFSCFSNPKEDANSDREKKANCFTLGKMLTMSSKSSPSVLLNVDSFIRTYQQGQVLGKGGFGAVHAGIRRHDRMPVAIKYIRKRRIISWGNLDGERLPLEYILLRQVSHLKGVIQLLDGVNVGSLFIIIMERMEPSKDLFHLIAEKGALPEKLAKCYFRQITDAVVGCFRAGVFHRDIKAENVMVNPETQLVKLIDFGCGTQTRRGRFTKPIGTPCYFPPELYCGGWYYGDHATVWSLGVLLYFMICGELPFKRKKEIVQALVRIKANVSPSCRDLVRKLLEFSPDQRMALEQITNHPWLEEEPPKYTYSVDEGLSSWNASFSTSSPPISESGVYRQGASSSIGMFGVCRPIDYDGDLHRAIHKRHLQYFVRTMPAPQPVRED